MLNNTYITVRRTTYKLNDYSETLAGQPIADVLKHKTHVVVAYQPFITKAKLFKIAEQKRWTKIDICNATNGLFDEHCFARIDEIASDVMINIDVDCFDDIPIMNMAEASYQGIMRQRKIFMGCKYIGSDDCVTGYVVSDGNFYVSSLICDEMFCFRKLCDAFVIQDGDPVFGRQQTDIIYRGEYNDNPIYDKISCKSATHNACMST
ncbi:MAG: hypothetical protein WC346_02115 [Methanogenium sp.]|jgi:hypothetical protein